jgi:hypothetical protein
MTPLIVALFFHSCVFVVCISRVFLKKISTTARSSFSFIHNVSFSIKMCDNVLLALCEPAFSKKLRPYYLIREQFFLAMDQQHMFSRANEAKID